VEEFHIEISPFYRLIRMASMAIMMVSAAKLDAGLAVDKAM
jgi:hypothetical protein